MNEPVIKILCQLSRAIAILGLACCAICGAQAQDFPFLEPEFERVSDVDTLDGNTITAMAQDARGLIWIGTQNRLVRYDGYRFRAFLHDAADPFSLAGDYVYALCATRDGRVVVGTTSDGISIFDPATERFDNFRHNPNVPDSLGGGKVAALSEDAQGGIWVATDQGLSHLPALTKRFVHFRQGNTPGSLMDDKLRSLLWDKTGRLWVGSSRGLQRMAKDGKSFETILSGVNVQALFQAQDGKLWLATSRHGAAWLMPDQTLPGAITAHWLPLAQLSHPAVVGIAQANAGQIWLATFGGGINVVAASDGKPLQVLRHDAARAGSLMQDKIAPLLLDRAGWLWVGTWGDGVQRSNLNNTMLRLLRHSPNQPQALSMPNIQSILELKNGQILFGSAGNGIDIFDRQQGLIGGYRKGAGQAGTLPDADIVAMVQVPDGAIWAGTQQGGIVRQLVGSSTWLPVPGTAKLQATRLLASRNDNGNGSVWIGTALGVLHWRPDANAVPNQASLDVLTDEDGKSMHSFVRTLAEDGQGRIWIGTDNGLWLQEPGRRGLIAITNDPQRAGSLVSDFILGLLLDSRGRLWVSTDKGLERLKSRDGKVAEFEHISTKLGLAGKALGGNLLEDEAGRIWTEEGVIDASTRHFEPLTKADGMDIGGGWIGSFAKTRDGLLLFGGLQGVAMINPRQFKPYDYAPPVLATALHINGQNVPLAGLALKMTTAGLTLTPDQRSFALEFAALDYAEPRKNRYQYRLQGYEQDWVNADADHRSANYGNLPPGSYTLQVRGSNRLGVFSAHELSIPVRILPAFWQTLWFRALVLLLLFSSLYGLYRWRITRLRAKARAQEQALQAQLTTALSHLQETQAKLIQAERQRLSLDLHDNLSQTMTGVLLQLDTARAVLTREAKPGQPDGLQYQAILPYVEGAMELARDGHTQTRQLLNALRSAKHKPTVINLLDTLRRDLPRLIMGTAITLDVLEEGEPSALWAELEVALFRIAQESVSNALRHGKAKKIVVLLAWESTGVTLSIRDEGIGFDPLSKSLVPGIGLQGMQERIAALGGKLSIDSAPGQGTCIRAAMPLFPE